MAGLESSGGFSPRTSSTLDRDDSKSILGCDWEPEHPYVASACGLGFSKPGGWVLRGHPKAERPEGKHFKRPRRTWSCCILASNEPLRPVQLGSKGATGLYLSTKSRSYGRRHVERRPWTIQLPRSSWLSAGVRRCHEASPVRRSGKEVFRAETIVFPRAPSRGYCIQFFSAAPQRHALSPTPSVCVPSLAVAEVASR